MDRRLHFFGIDEAGFDPDNFPQHVLERMVRRFGGDRSITVERHDLSLEEAIALRRCLAEALRRIDARLEEATGEPLEAILAG